MQCSVGAATVRRAFAVVLAAGAATAAHAEPLRITQKQTGQAIYLPYYTASGGRSTVVSIVNDDLDDAKAVRVVFAEARNGRAALEFNLYLQPGDSWNGTVVAQLADRDPGVVYLLEDASCAIPSDTRFRHRAFSGANADGLGEGLERTLSGAVEIIELGVLEGAAKDLVASGICGDIEQAFAAGLWKDDPNASLSAPQGGISASAEILDVDAGRMWSVEGIAIEGFSHTPRHGRADDVHVRLTDPQPGPNGTFVVEYERYLDEPARITLSGERPADAMSLAFSAWALAGDYALTPPLSGEAEWIVAFPTRQAYVDDRPGGTLPAGAAPLAPFREQMDTCEYMPILVLGRDGQKLAPPFRGSIDGLDICDQVSHFSLTRPITIIPEPAEGRVWIDFADLGRQPLPGVSHYGMPVVGVALQAYTYTFPGAAERMRPITSAHALRRMGLRTGVVELRSPSQTRPNAK